MPWKGLLDFMTPTLLDTPMLGPNKIALRPYQEAAITAVRREFVTGRKGTLLVMATGLGKTITFGMIARQVIEKGGRPLILAHRKELISQAVNKLDLLGVQAEVERAEMRARALYEPDAVVATVQTLKGDRLKSWPQDHFRLVIVDEAHHATAPSYRTILDHFTRAKVLGVTATVDRADEEDLGQVFDSIADEYGLFWAMTAPPPGPYLCRLKFVQCDLDIDLKDLRQTKDDYNEADLEARIAPLADTLANALRQEFGDRRTIVFTPGVKSAQGIATALQSLGVRADWSSGEDKDRDAKIQRFRDGGSQVFVNCGIATEGFDVPEVGAIGLCRPTKSRLLYSQMVGRGTRLAKDKPDCLLIDFNYLTAKHDLVKPAELFDSANASTEVTDEAGKVIDKAKGTPVDLLEAIEEGREEHKRKQVLRVQARERNIAYRKVSYDPLAVCDVLGLPWRGSKDAVTNRPSEKQIEYLKGFGVEDAPNLSKHRASTMIDYLKVRRERGLATFKQTAWLIAKGVDPEVARVMSFREASDRLDELFRGRRTG
jgi:superfamily II DNA or RNA helicase